MSRLEAASRGPLERGTATQWEPARGYAGMMSVRLDSGREVWCEWVDDNHNPDNCVGRSIEMHVDYNQTRDGGARRWARIDLGAAPPRTSADIDRARAQLARLDPYGTDARVEWMGGRACVQYRPFEGPMRGLTGPSIQIAVDGLVQNARLREQTAGGDRSEQAARCARQGSDRSGRPEPEARRHSRCDARGRVVSDGDCRRCGRRFSQSDTRCRGCGKLKRNGNNASFPLRLSIVCEVIAAIERGRSMPHVGGTGQPGSTVLHQRGRMLFI